MKACLRGRQPMSFSELIKASILWSTWFSLAFAGLTFVAFLTRWRFRFRLVGVSSFISLLAISSWAFSISYAQAVVIEGAIRVPIVFDNGKDLVVAQAPKNISSSAIQPTLEQVAANIRSSGRGGHSVQVRLRQLRYVEANISEPVIIGEMEHVFR